MYTLDKIPFFQQIEDSKNILLAGAGGGLDVFCAVPLLFALKKVGKKICLANFSFTLLDDTSAEEVFPFCYKIKASDKDHSGRNYFPEKHLCEWLQLEGLEVDVFTFNRTGIQPLTKAYQYLINEYSIDAIVLVDGGTDSLMIGDEEGLGTPQEDICSMAAVFNSGIAKQFLVSVGFGIDDYHGVSHVHFLENVAAIAKAGGYLGIFQMLHQMEESQKYIAAVDYVNKQMKGMESIVSNSIVSALEAEFGDYHKIERTKKNKLWINPLMTIYWCFELQAVIAKNKYYSLIKDTDTIGELNTILFEYRSKLAQIRERLPIPL